MCSAAKRAKRDRTVALPHPAGHTVTRNAEKPEGPLATGGSSNLREASGRRLFGAGNSVDD